MDNDDYVKTNATRTDQNDSMDDDYVKTNNAQTDQEDLIDQYNLGNREANPVLFGSDGLVDKMSDNMATAEADIDETPLITENSYDENNDTDSSDGNNAESTYDAEPNE